MQHRSEASDEQIYHLLDLSPQAIISADDQQRIVLFSRGAETMFGYSAAEVVGQRLDILLPHAAVARHRALVDGVLAGESMSRAMGERRMVHARRSNDELFEVEISFGHLKMPGGSALVAIVQDVSALRSAERALTGVGIAVLKARDAVEALSIARNHRGTIDAVLSDVVLPGMSGQDTVAAIVEMRPAVATVFMSGYSQDVVEKHGELRPDSVFIGKPFTRESLLSALRLAMQYARSRRDGFAVTDFKIA